MTAAIALRGVSKFYGKQRGVVDLDLEIVTGDVFGYLGPNGAGKTTTIRLLLDLIRPSGGAVEVLGGHPSDPAIRRRIGYLPGDFGLYENLSTAELVEYFGGLRGLDSFDYAWQLAERLELDTARPMKDLSKGNRQKVGALQALMHQPDLLVLDEPTSALDPLVQQTFYELLAEAHDQGATIFFSSHVLSEVERVADRVGIIREGVLAEVETLEALRSRAVRRYEVTFAGPVPAGLGSTPGVRDLEVDGNVATCGIVGPLGPFLSALATFEAVDLYGHGVDLEELFLSFYQGDAS